MSNFAVRKKHVVIIGNYADYHYTESFMYDKQGNIRNLTRWDNSDIMNLLSFQYSGNQLVKVSDNGYPPISYDEKRYHDDSNEQIEFQYDQNGNLIYDSDRKICSIRYNVLNLPDTIQFSDGKQIVHVYDAEGTRLQTTYYTPKVTMTVPPFSVLISTDNLQNYNIVSYAMVGNKRYVRSGHGSWQLQDVLNPEGYTRYYTPEEHYRFYYIKDHLGNVREVYVNPDPGYKECVQRTQYYPTGLPWNEGMYPSEQPFKYNGKEFVEMHGLDEYDSEARWYYPAIMRTTTMDPLCEKYYSISPYAWCGNNPVNLVDPDGRETLNEMDSVADPELYKAAEHYKINYDDEQTIIVFAHGSEDYIVLSNGTIISSGEEFETYLEKHSLLWQNTTDKSQLKIVIMSCNTGRGENSIAAKIGQVIQNTPILAPTTEIIQLDNQIKGAFIQENIKLNTDLNKKKHRRLGYIL